MNKETELGKQQNIILKTTGSLRRMGVELLYFGKWALILSGIFTWYMMHMIYNYNLSFGIPGFYRGEEMTTEMLEELYYTAKAQEADMRRSQEETRKRGKK
jgi:hypothetical protein